MGDFGCIPASTRAGVVAGSKAARLANRLPPDQIASAEGARRNEKSSRSGAFVSAPERFRTRDLRFRSFPVRLTPAEQATG